MAIDKPKLTFNPLTGSFDVTQDVSGLLPKDGSEAMTGPLDMGSNVIENVADPVALQDAATKNTLKLINMINLLIVLVK